MLRGMNHDPPGLDQNRTLGSKAEYLRAHPRKGTIDICLSAALSTAS
jgi:hypothetical protein